MDVVILAVAGLAVLAVAFGVVGRAVIRLERQPEPAVLEVDAAVAWIVDRVPTEVAGRLSERDVQRLVVWHIDELDRIGLTSDSGAEIAPADPAADDPAGTTISTAEFDEITDAIVARGLLLDEPYEAVDVIVVLDLYSQYLTHIGAIRNS